MAEPLILIKKYPNRRLYDTSTSVYITLADIKLMVLHHDNFKIVDFKTGTDLTRSVLLQIILDEEAGGAPILTSDLLSRMIRFYGNTMQGMMGKYLEGNIKTLSDIQTKLSQQGHLPGSEHPSMSGELWARFLKFQGSAMQDMMDAYIAQSQVIFKQMQEHGQTHNAFAGFRFPNFVVPVAEINNIGKK